MNSINQLGISAAQQAQNNIQSPISKIGSVTTYGMTIGIGSATPRAQTQISSLSSQLSDAAIRATRRDASNSRDGLAAIAQLTVDKLLGGSYQANKAAHDLEVAASDDPQRLAQASQATDFSNGKSVNPFKGISRDQLALITYDDSDSFTINERRAAWQESYDQEQAWKLHIIATMNADYEHKGKVSSDTYKEILDHYISLPVIEEAQLPKGYKIQLQSLIQQADNGESSQHNYELKKL